jgi:hypothetical protein
MKFRRDVLPLLFRIVAQMARWGRPPAGRVVVDPNRRPLPAAKPEKRLLARRLAQLGVTSDLNTKKQTIKAYVSNKTTPSGFETDS